MSEIRPAPYPATTKAKGWRFELDMEQVRQSDTWDVAAEIPMAQHTLLMMWSVAWLQVPCGSLPADPELLRAKLKVPPKLWAPMREVVMRGWWLAEDGRLYHKTITARVMSMIEHKDAERTRKAEYRAKMDAERKTQESGGVPQMSHGTDTGQTPESARKDDTGTGTGTSLNTPPPLARDSADTVVVFPMTKDWSPSEGFVVQAKLAALPVKDEAFMASGRDEFIAYWLTRPQDQNTQAGWEHALAKSLKHAQARAASTPQRPAAKRAGSHTGFDTKDYREGVNPDGSLA